MSKHGFPDDCNCPSEDICQFIQRRDCADPAPSLAAMREALRDALEFIEYYSRAWNGVSAKHPNTIATNARNALAASVASRAACQHRIADARNAHVQSGYVCLDCGAIFQAADHVEAKDAVRAEAVAWMTHHDDPMLFPTRAEAETYCDDDEDPIPLYAAPTTLRQPEAPTFQQGYDKGISECAALGWKTPAPANSSGAGRLAVPDDTKRLDWIERNVCDVSRLGDAARTLRISWNNGADYAYVGPRYNANWREAIDTARAAAEGGQA